METASLVPPFTYNNQCGSVVLTAYIPVFLLGYSIQLVLPLILLAVLTCLSHDSIPSSVRMMFHGIIWPEYWLHGGDAVLAHNNGNPSRILAMRPILCNDVCNNWLVMVTFGLCSPILAVAIACSVVLKMSLWVLLIGRFTKRSLLDRDGGSGGSSSDARTPVPAVSRVVASAATTSRTTVTAPCRPPGIVSSSGGSSCCCERSGGGG